MSRMHVGRRTVPGGAPMVLEVVADIIGVADPSELHGYVVIGLTAPGASFRISSNARDDDAEIRIIETVLQALKAARPGGAT